MTPPSRIGRFKILELLGQGAMGQVYLGEDSDLGRQVAIKVIASTADDETRERFRHEARSIAQLAHPNIVLVHEFGFEGDSPYLVMECLEGSSLEDWLGQPRPLAALLSVLRDLCRAVDHAHQRDILHRDIKPSNVQVLHDGSAKLVDFGIARSGSVQLTATGMVLGTPEYLAPEILSDVRYSRQSDLYAVSLVVYRTLTGHHPFRAQNLEACLTRILTQTAPPLAELCPHLPEELCTVVDRGLAKDPEQRPGDLHPLEAALNLALAKASANTSHTANASHTTNASHTANQQELETGRTIPTHGLDLTTESPAPRPNETTSLPQTIPLAAAGRPLAQRTTVENPQTAGTSKTVVTPRGKIPPPERRPPRRTARFAFLAFAATTTVALAWWWQATNNPLHLSTERAEDNPQVMTTGSSEPPATPPAETDEFSTPPPRRTDEMPPTALGDAATTQTTPTPKPAEPSSQPLAQSTTERPDTTPKTTASTTTRTNAEPPHLETATSSKPPATGTISPELEVPEPTAADTAEPDTAEPHTAEPHTAETHTTADPTTARPTFEETSDERSIARPPTQTQDLPKDLETADAGSDLSTAGEQPGGQTGPQPETVAGPRIVIESISPTVIRRGTTTTLVVHGTGFSADDRALFERSGQPAEALRVQRLTLDRQGRLRIVISVAHTEPLGTHTLSIVNTLGASSAPVHLEVGL